MKIKCLHGKGNECIHPEVGEGIVVEHSLKHKWNCHTCGYFTPK